MKRKDGLRLPTPMLLSKLSTLGGGQHLLSPKETADSAPHSSSVLRPPPYGVLYLDTGPVIINEITKNNHITITPLTLRDLPVIPIIFTQPINPPLSTGISTLVETHTSLAVDAARSILSNDYTVLAAQLQTQFTLVTNQIQQNLPS